MSWPAMAAALVVPLLCALIYVVWIPHGNAGRGAWFATKVWVLVYPLFFFGLIGLGGLFRRESRSGHWPSWGTVVVTGVLSGLGIVLAGWILVLTPVGEIVRENSHNLVEKANGLGFASKERFLIVAIFITVLHSAMEEYYWRWFVYGHLHLILALPTLTLLSLYPPLQQAKPQLPASCYWPPTTYSST